MDSLSKDVILKNLKYDLPLSVFQEIDSTSDYLRKSVTANSPEGEIVLAESQTCGRGRRGKSFFSPEKTGLYFSILLKPKADIYPAQMTLAAAVSVCVAIERLTDKKPQIKWVNDIFLENKKICGILTEMHRLENSKFYILGIGINVYEPTLGFPEDIKNSASFLLSYESENFKSLLAAEIINSYFDMTKSFRFHDILKEYSSRLAGIGKKIKVLGNNSYEAVMLGVNDVGELIVECEDGSKKALSSGEISILL